VKDGHRLSANTSASKIRRLAPRRLSGAVNGDHLMTVTAAVEDLSIRGVLCRLNLHPDVSLEGMTAMTFLTRGLLVATTALLLTAFGFAQSNTAEPDQYSNDVFHTDD